MPQLAYVNASCHCALNTFRVGFLTSSLPISTDLCHCSTCRHSTGQLSVEQVTIYGAPLAHTVFGSRNHSGNRSRSRSPAPFARGEGKVGNNEQGSGKTSAHATFLAPPTVPTIVVEPEVPLDLGDLTAYKTSPNVTRYFCNSCSSHLFFVVHAKATNPDTGEEEQKDRWAVAVGALEETEGLVQIGYHIWVGDTLDGGIADHLRRIEGVGELPRYKEDVGSPLVPIGWNAVQPVPTKATTNADATPDSSDQLLEAFCHCGALRFALTRPTPESSLPTVMYSDLLYPYDVSPLSKIHNPKDEKWWLAPRHSTPKTKYLAGHCMCTFCRLTSGFEVQSWAFVPLVNVLVPGAEAGEWVPLCLETEEERPKGLKQYISSPGRYREFCGTCGATAFWWRAAVPGLLDVSVGLFDESINGTRAEGWLEWCTERVSFAEKALSPEVAKALGEGLKESANKMES